MGRVKTETINGAKWQFLQKLTMQPVQFVYSVLLARLVTPEEFGIMGLTSIFFALATLLADSGFSTALIRDPNRTKEDINTVFWTNLVITTLMCALLWLAAPLFAIFFRQPILVWLTRVSAIMMLLNSTCGVHFTLYTCRRDFKTPAIINVVTTVIGMPITVYCAYLGWGCWALMVQGIVSGIAKLAMVWWLSPWKPQCIWSRDSFDRFFSFGSKLLVNGIIDTCFAHMKNLAIGRIYSAVDLGLFNRANHIAKLPVDTINSVLGNVTLPILATLQSDRSRLLNVYSKYIRVTSLAIFFGCFLLCALAEPFIALCYGPRWLICVGYAQILLMGLMGSHYTVINLNLLIVMGRSDLVMKLNFIRKALALIAIISALCISMYAVCWAALLVVPFNIAVNTYYPAKLYGMTLRRQMQDFMPYLLYSLLCCAPAYALTFTPLPHYAQLALGVSLSTGLYIGLLLCVKDAIFTDLLRTITHSPRWPFKKRIA